MPIFEVTRTVRETQVIRAADEDDALEHLATDETFQHYNGWVTDLHPPRVERP